MVGKTESSKLKVVSHGSDDDDDDNEEEEEEDKGDDCYIPFEKLIISPTRKLLVLNLGGLLAHRVRHKDKASIPKSRRPDGVFGKQLVFKRPSPFCNEFISFCLDRFELGIWSTAMEWNVHNVMECVMGASSHRLAFIWDQEQCTDTGFETLEKKGKPIFLKQLKKLWDKDFPGVPWLKGKYSASNTLLIDDTPYKALLNPPDTAIFPHPYKADDANDNTLGPKGELRVFLEGLADADDVPSYVKEHRIGQPPITSGHTDWEFYSKFIGIYK